MLERGLQDHLAYLASVSDIPTLDFDDSRYEVRFAATRDEVERALELRYRVFNLELGEGLPESISTGRDEDEFDLVCRHLIVVERSSGDIVGTYRLQSSTLAAAGLGFYSQTEFDLSSMPREVLDDSVELGRACIAREHRNTRVLFLLWRGLAAYVMHNGKRYLFGCCSLTSQDEGEGIRAHRRLEREGRMHSSIRVQPLPGLECRENAGGEDLAEPQIPRLFGMYLKYGAVVCGPPAIDRVFGTIDFLVLLDVERMDPRQAWALFGLS